jgi:chemotaxis protein CheX
MDLKQGLINASTGIFPQFGMNSIFQGGIEENQLASANQVNILIGFSGGLTGTIVISFNKATAVKIASSMMKCKEINTLDIVAWSAISEITGMIAGQAMANVGSEAKINFSPPTVVTGERIFLLISRLKSNKLTFKLDDNLYNISYCIE